MVRNGVRVLSTRMARRSRRGGLSGQADPADRAVRGRGRSGRAGASVSKRMAALPDVPTIAEMLPGFDALNWFVLAAPAGTLVAVIDRLHAATPGSPKKPAPRRRAPARGSAGSHEARGAAPDVRARWPRCGGQQPCPSQGLHCARDRQVDADHRGTGLAATVNGKFTAASPTSQEGDKK